MSSDEKDVNYFIEKFESLADEARGYGHRVVIVLENDDPIARQTGVKMIYRGGHISAMTAEVWANAISESCD